MGIDQGGCSDPDELALTAALVIDPRIADVWQVVWAGLVGRDPPDDETLPLGSLGCLLRLAYLHGYADAAAEPVPHSLYRELGVRDPRPLSPRISSARRRGRGRARPGSSGR